MNVLETLEARGFVKSSTDRDSLTEALAGDPVTFYVGLDPTGASLHVGHLVPIMAMAWLQRAGHRPIVVLGGGTAMVGDPSGKDQTREVLSEETIAAYLGGYREQVGRFLDLQESIVVDNSDWLRPLSYIDFLREIGRHFSVNRMLTAESVRLRLERDQGLSFIEFNYHLLQSYDFLVLYQNHGCTLQLGGDDQWFNILGGVDLIRRVEGAVAHGVTVPLILTATGAKMGKTEKGATWLDADRCSVYDYYQYWVNADDRDVGRWLRLYTFLDLERIAELEALQGADIREAKSVLALEATALAHGREAAERAAEAARAAFSGAVSQDMPTYSTSLPLSVVDVLTNSGLCKSKSAARRLIQQGGARIGDAKVSDVDALLSEEEVVWAGKKRAVRVVAA